MKKKKRKKKIAILFLNEGGKKRFRTGKLQGIYLVKIDAPQVGSFRVLFQDPFKHGSSHMRNPAFELKNSHLRYELDVLVFGKAQQGTVDNRLNPILLLVQQPLYPPQPNLKILTKR